MQIFNSFILLQKEKLIVIKKELRHLWYISNYYNYKELDNNTNNEEMTQRASIASKISQEIELHLKYISKLNKEIEESAKHTQEILLFLSLYDKKNNELSELLKIVKLIQSKLTQFLQDHFNQYLPIPMTTKRYSSKGFLDYIKEFHHTILYSIDSTIQMPIMLWSHTMRFKAKSSLYEENKAHYIEMAYWYYEIPFLLPTITHELGHILLESKNSNPIKDIKNIFKKNLKINDFFINDGTDGFLDEIICDMLGYIVHDTTYLIVMVHELLGIDFSQNFLNDAGHISIQPISINNKRFNEALIRISLILEFESWIHENKNITITKEIKKIMSHLIIPLSKESNNLDSTEELNKCLQRLIIDNKSIEPQMAYIYTVIYPNLIQSYKNFHSTIYESILLIYQNSSFNNGLKSLSEKIFEVNKIVDSESKNLNFPEIFKKLYSNRIDHISSSITKNQFRELILNTDKLKENELDKIGKPYELTLFKTRTDAYKGQEDYFNTLTENINTLYFNTPSYEESDKDIYFTFDLFSALTLVEKSDKLNEEEINNFLDYEKIDNSQGVFFTYKYSLIKLWEKDKDKNIDKKSDNLYFNIIMQIQLTENNSEKTEEGLKELVKYFKNKNYSVEVFKALGPKELVINCKEIDIDTIFRLKKEVIALSTTIFRRTYTIIYGDNNYLQSFKSSDKYYITTTLRLKSTTPLNKIIHKNIKYKFYLTGVTDIQLIWKDETSIEDIFNFYNDLTKQAYTSDIQTKIAKNII